MLPRLSQRRSSRTIVRTRGECRWRTVGRSKSSSPSASGASLEAGLAWGLGDVSEDGVFEATQLRVGLGAIFATSGAAVAGGEGDERTWLQAEGGVEPLAIAERGSSRSGAGSRATDGNSAESISRPVAHELQTHSSDTSAAETGRPTTSPARHTTYCASASWATVPPPRCLSAHLPGDSQACRVPRLTSKIRRTESFTPWK